MAPGRKSGWSRRLVRWLTGEPEPDAVTSAALRHFETVTGERASRAYVVEREGSWAVVRIFHGSRRPQCRAYLRVPAFGEGPIECLSPEEARPYDEGAIWR